MNGFLHQEQAVPRPPSEVAGRRAIVALSLASMLGWLNGAALSPFLPDIASDLQTTIPLLGQITTILFILGAGVSLIVGPLADARGTRRLLVGGLLAVTLCSLGTAIAPNFWPLLIMRLTGAFSAGTLGGVTLAVAATMFSGADQRRAIGWVASGVAGGAVVGIPLLTAAGSLLGWRLAFVVMAGAALLVLALLVSSLPDDAKAQPSQLRAMLAAYLPLLRDNNMLALYSGSALRSIGWMGFLVYAGAFFKGEHGLTTQEVGWTYTVGGLGFFLGIQATGGRLGNRPLRPIYAGAALISGLCLGMMLVMPVGVIIAVALLTITAFALGICNVCLSTLLATETPAGRGTTMALNASVLELGTAGGGAVGGLLIALGGYTALGLGLPLFTWISTLLIAWKPRRDRQMAAVPSSGG